MKTLAHSFSDTRVRSGFSIRSIRRFPVENLWCLHSYYTLCPYAPDGSERILAAGANLSSGNGEVLVLSPQGEVMDRFGSHAVENGFFHTGWWQTWSPDAKAVYFQSGSLASPTITHRELATGKETTIVGDMEGAPPHGEPIISGLMGMLYAAGYGDGKYKPDQAPVPFQSRDRHGLFEYRFSPASSTLRMGINQLFDLCPDQDYLRSIEREIQSRLGEKEGATLMAYCVRWCADGSRFLFHFGNHSTSSSRKEPRLLYVMTADREMREIHVALNLCQRPGVHWSWQPDGEWLIGYGPDPDAPNRPCLAEVRYDGTGYRKISSHASGGHPTVSPVNPDLIVTDEGVRGSGAVVFFSKKSGKELSRVELPKYIGYHEPPGRNALRVCHHPVFHRKGDRVLCNSLPGENAVLTEIEVNI